MVSKHAFCLQCLSRNMSIGYNCNFYPQRPFKCEFEGCGKSFIRPYHLKRHSLIHTGQEIFKYTIVYSYTWLFMAPREENSTCEGINPLTPRSD